jgi:predicted AlkP superfamily phosphohydrolase/phosphomutase
VRTDIIERLERMVDPADGRKVVTGVYRREDLYSGPYLDEAPDIVVIMRDLAYITRHGYEFGEEAGAVFTTPHQGQSGSHRLDGLLVAAGPGIARHGAEREVVSLMDVLPTALHIIGCGVPEGLDGKVAQAWLDAAAASRSVKYTESGTPAGTEGGGTNKDFTEEEEEEVTRRLKDLGYLG